MGNICSEHSDVDICEDAFATLTVEESAKMMRGRVKIKMAFAKIPFQLLMAAQTRAEAIDLLNQCSPQAFLVKLQPVLARDLASFQKCLVLLAQDEVSL